MSDELTFKEVMEAEDKAYKSIRESRKPADWESRIIEVNSILSGKNMPSHRRAYLLKEAMTTSDFPMLFGDVLDRMLLANYQAKAPVWKAFMKQSVLNDFRLNYRFRVWGSDNNLDVVPEKGEYPLGGRDTIRYPIRAKKYGRRFEIDWESIVNDDLGALQDTPTRFATAAIRTESRLATGLYAGDVGTHMDEQSAQPWPYTDPTTYNLFQLTNDAGTTNTINCIADTLSIAALIKGLAAMAQFTDLNGEPVENSARLLVVPPVLEIPAREYVTSAWKMWVDQNGGATPTAYPMNNVLAQTQLQVVVDPYLPFIDKTNGQTGWYLFADPSAMPCMEFAHMSGHEVPEIAMHVSNKMTVGGGPISPMAGDFESDNILYRVRVIAGVTKLDWRGCFMGGKVS
ncbi:MAG: hypothetical protein ABSG90_12310 [Dehalococcoidia bacterium]|jgi:hypothetical protein